MCSKQRNDEPPKQPTQNASDTVTALMSATDKNGYLPADLTRVVVFAHVTTGVAAVRFPLRDDSCDVSMTNGGGVDAHVLL